MSSIQIQGGIGLAGKVRIQGSKNASLPVLAATLLTEGSSVIRNCPRITDVNSMISLLRSLGCTVRRTADGLRVDTEGVSCEDMPAEAVTGMRSSLCLLGALIGRCGHVSMEYPGGCVIGERPIDLHLRALSQMGVCFREERGKLVADADALHGADISLAVPSVGATENILLAAVAARGDTCINGAAKEPEITALCEYLTGCGAVIEGAGSERVIVRGGNPLQGTVYTVPPDRIVAGTYVFACIGAGGSVLLENAPREQMGAVLDTATGMGAECIPTQEGIYVRAPEKICPVPYLCTESYPGFPTDLQSAALSVLTVAAGKSCLEEKIFENRFRVVEPLKRMGANIEIDGRKVFVSGVRKLHGTAAEAKELRGGAALVIAGLMAEGTTMVSGCSYIDRGYENICNDLRELGARVSGV